MSTFPVAEVRPGTSARAAKLSPPQAAGAAATLAVLGTTTIWSTALFLWDLWTTDALKSIGMFIPVVSFVLILRAWKSLDWEMNGSAWGLFILFVTITAVRLRDQAVLVLVLSPSWSIYIPPHSLVAFAYGAGVVLLLGGFRLFRAALFPVILLWFVNPIPHVFNVLVDLPLQRVSAHVARGFATALGQPLSPDQLRLMFTPHFGMFIAPGCNGIRGAVTMGFIALIAGYVYRFRWYAHTAVVCGAILLGYIFNFVRLCVLVLYYIVALHVTWLQKRAEMGDYIIGGCLFLLATFLLFYAIRRLSVPANQIPVAENNHSHPKVASQPTPWLRLSFMLALALFGCVGAARSLVHNHSAEVLSAKQKDRRSLDNFPSSIGDYKLVRTWNENLNAATLLFHWAEYAPANGGPHVSIGISPILGSHETLICHSARGEDPLWLGQLNLPTAAGPVAFSSSFYNDSAVQFLEATTMCNGSGCGEYSSARTHFGLVYSRPSPQALFSQDPSRPIPILIRAETIDTTLAADKARQQMSEAVAGFVGAANLDQLTRPYRHR